jgi:colanic acid/amylovoran biosynthesis protein
VAGEVRRLVDHADALFVRDRTSLAVVEQVAGPRPTVRLAPDLTVLADAVGGREADVVLVPNERLVGGRDHPTAESYVAVLEAAGSAAMCRGATVAVLLHSADPGDRTLGSLLAEALAVPMLGPMDAARAKGIVASCELVVGSRFHALLGALSCGVPAVAVGWAHKYDELFADFGVPQLSLGPAPTADELRAAVDEVFEDRATIGREVATAAERMRAASARMWGQVLDVLRPAVR